MTNEERLKRLSELEKSLDVASDEELEEYIRHADHLRPFIQDPFNRAIVRLLHGILQRLRSIESDTERIPTDRTF